jgi:hypothetical protein
MVSRESRFYMMENYTKMKKKKHKNSWLKERRNQFDISDGNLDVLKAIPEMMMDEKWRDKLRLIAMEFRFQEINKRALNRIR